MLVRRQHRSARDAKHDRVDRAGPDREIGMRAVAERARLSTDVGRRRLHTKTGAGESEYSIAGRARTDSRAGDAPRGRTTTRFASRSATVQFSQRTKPWIALPASARRAEAGAGGRGTRTTRLRAGSATASAPAHGPTCSSRSRPYPSSRSASPTRYDRSPPPTSTTTARCSPAAISVCTPEGALMNPHAPSALPRRTRSRTERSPRGGRTQGHRGRPTRDPSRCLPTRSTTAPGSRCGSAPG